MALGFETIAGANHERTKLFFKLSKAIGNLLSQMFMTLLVPHQFTKVISLSFSRSIVHSKPIAKIFSSAQSNNNKYRKSFIAGKGNVLLAAVDMLPGETVMIEEPLLSLPADFVNKKEYISLEQESMDGLFPRNMWAMRDKCKAWPLETLDKLLNLHSPTVGGRAGKTADMFRSSARPIFERHGWQSEDLELFVKLRMVDLFNSFGKDNHRVDIYHMISRMSHSCRPNCDMNANNDQSIATIRCIKPVKSGDELTISYHDGSLLKSTAERRKHY
jgi:hypothetical protein